MMEFKQTGLSVLKPTNCCLDNGPTNTHAIEALLAERGHLDIFSPQRNKDIIVPLFEVTLERVIYIEGFPDIFEEKSTPSC